jgi:hypothetical protein
MTRQTSCPGRLVHVAADAAYHGPARPMTSPPPRAGRGSPSPPTADKGIGHVAEITCLWYGSWHTRTVRLILSRDERTASGYDLALITTDLAASPVALVARYAAPWGIEQAFADARNVLAPARPAAASGAPSSAPSRSPCSCTP